MKNLNERQCLWELKELVWYLQSAASTLTKEDLIFSAFINTPQLIPYFRAVYDPFKQYHLTHDVAVKPLPFNCDGTSANLSILDVLNAMDSRTLSGHEACGVWQDVLLSYATELHPVLEGLLNKDLKCRVGLATVNKALRALRLPLIHEHRVSLGHAWDGCPVWKNGTWYASRKLDGVRLNAVLLPGGGVQVLSRQGKPFTTLLALVQSLSGHELDGVLDGELSLRNSERADDFQGLMCQIRRKDHQIENLMFHVFDWIPTDGGHTMTFAQRQVALRKVFHKLDSEYIRVVPQQKVLNTEHFLHLKKMANRKGWEGLILRRNVPYKPGRSKDILKVKEFHEAEYTVEGTLNGKMSIVSGGREKEIKIMSKAIIRHKGCDVGVGSGWSVSQRREFFQNPEKIIGQVITVQYFDETQNKNGGFGLRFPTVKALHGDERTM